MTLTKHKIGEKRRETRYLLAGVYPDGPGGGVALDEQTMVEADETFRYEFPVTKVNLGWHLDGYDWSTARPAQPGWMARFWMWITGRRIPRAVAVHGAEKRGQ